MRFKTMSHNLLSSISSNGTYGNNDLKNSASAYLVGINAVGVHLATVPQQDITKIKDNQFIEQRTIDIKNPNNPAKREKAKLITLSW